ncbi:glycine--tRNA ligase subunit beta [Candidatus Bandiella euplotis]|uniref:glycine--tRNA ligase n=1 Tax=Candidatus Bandiella euplotis TaxID=1664265 RepID=A0ABZ0UL25_9RICK|nr:glycine--tRNA ligase subunit beta [Candidatus Bandiella woodruffii]WPX96834.1 Glycine--tRNA ligase beta subunit [Candidatus Bandiella woodruffii]
MSELLFEIYSEEIPSEMQEYGAKKLYDMISTKLEELFDHKIIGQYFFTPRRIGFYIESIPTILQAKIEEVRGPKIQAPKNAIDGFLKKYNLTETSELVEKNGYYHFLQKMEGKSTLELLHQLLEEVVATFPWPKSMKWANYQIKWIRPIHSILCVYGGKVIPVKYGHITASNITTGRWMLNEAMIQVNSFSEYQTNLQKAEVEIFQEQRINSIKKQVEQKIANLNVSMIEDHDLLHEVANLVESPYVAIGKIDSKFMQLPKEVLVTTLKFHQKYLMMECGNKELAPYFIIVSNIMTDDGLQTVITGNEKVLKARLSDAEFFYTQDTNTKLIDKFQALKKVTFHHEIGSYYDKIQLIKQVAVDLAKQLQVDQSLVEHTTLLIKSDLVTDMVKELPELQGIVGYYYALKDGETKEVAAAIKEHYLPQGPSDPVVTSNLSILMALADKMVTLNSMFKIGIKPTGSKDPFALRRAAIGIIRIICANQLSLKVHDMLRSDVINFILDRVEILEKEIGEGKNAYLIDLCYIKEALITRS